MTEPPLPPGSYPPPPQGGNVPPPAGYYPPAGYHPVPPVYALPKEAYTPWITRVAAYLVDAVPVLVLTGIGQAVLVGTGTSQSQSGLECGFGNPEDQCTYYAPSALGLVTALVLGLAALAFAIWNYGYRQGTTGSSIGKSVLKFAVVSERTGRPIGFWPSLGRQLAHLLDTVFCSIGYLWPLWDAKRQTFADKIMATVCLPIRKDSL